MKEKIGSVVLLGSFIIILCFSWLLWILLEKQVDVTNYENRELNTKPRLTVDNYKTFSSEYDNYFNDNIPFRNTFISLNTSIDYFLFNRSTSEFVIAGKDNWLFYNKESDGNPLECYLGTNKLSEEQLEKIAANCVKQKEYIESLGKEFVIFIAPNKERIYSENMPKHYGTPSECYKVLQIVNYLREHTDIRVVYPYDELIEAKKAIGYNLYYRTDTHWNLIGGYIGANTLLGELGINMPSIESDEINIIVGEAVSGDLANMLNLSKQLKVADKEYEVNGYDKHDIEMLEYDFQTVFHYKANNADSRRIYIVRDSFLSSMSEYIGSQFDESYFRYFASYSYEDFEKYNPDIFVYETVERYVDKLEVFSVQ